MEYNARENFEQDFIKYWNKRVALFDANVDFIGSCFDSSIYLNWSVWIGLDLQCRDRILAFNAKNYIEFSIVIGIRIILLIKCPVKRKMFARIYTIFPYFRPNWHAFCLSQAIWIRSSGSLVFLCWFSFRLWLSQSASRDFKKAIPRHWFGSKRISRKLRHWNIQRETLSEGKYLPLISWLYFPTVRHAPITGYAFALSWRITQISSFWSLPLT